MTIKSCIDQSQVKHGSGLDPAQMELALEDLETAIAETQARIAAVEKKIEASAINSGEVGDRDKAVSRKERKAPVHCLNTCRGSSA